MNRAFDDLFGVAGAFDGIQMAGRTDLWILAAAASRANVETHAGGLRPFPRSISLATHRSARRACLRKMRAPWRVRSPGGNRDPKGHSARAPHRKLRSGRADQAGALRTLEILYRCGAYGDEVTSRNDLFGVAVERAHACGYRHVRPADVIVIGDTVLDVACAQAAGARSLAVATGTTDMAELRASGADTVLENLGNTEEILELLPAGNRTRS